MSAKDEDEQMDDTLVGFFEETQLSKTVKRKNVPKPTVKQSDDIRLQLIESWKEKEAKKQKLSSLTEEEMDNGVHLQDLMQEAQEIGVVRKDNVFKEAITKEEQEIINQRVAAQRKTYMEYEKRELLKKFLKVSIVHSFVTEEECKYALKECNDDEEEVCVFFTDYFNLQSVRKKIAQEAEAKNKQHEPINNTVEDSELDPSMFISRKRKNKDSPSRSKKSGEKVTVIDRKLRLDDALKKDNFEGWSEARIKAFKMREINPNAYYYRFNDPGEAQRNGAWTKEEVALFYKRMEEVGVNGQWGVFAMAIPGRVGYQCSNFYRQLIETHKIKDPNYVVDEKGKAHFLFKNPSKRGKSKDDKDNDTYVAKPAVTTKKARKKKKAKHDQDDDNEEDDDDDKDQEYRPGGSSRRREEEEEAENEGPDPNNPLPGFIDPITLEEVIKPAISPFGHVMSYSTWSRCLMQEPRNTCPITKKALKKRELTVLTWENIDEYRDKIVWDSQKSKP